MENFSLPGIMHVDHVALTVPNLDDGVRFYTEMLGAVELYRLGPFDANELPAMPDGVDWTRAHLNIAGARLRLAMLALAPNLMLELFQYERPHDAVLVPPRNCDAGASHIALRVRDLEEALTFLRDRGLRVMNGPISIGDGPCAGLRLNYFLDPFGNQLELVQYGHLPYMDEKDAPLYARRAEDDLR